MNDYQDRLIMYLLERNDYLSYGEARIWVELLWDDFETTSAKAGREYLGSETTERIVKQWIEQYGKSLHEFSSQNPKYKEYFIQGKYTLH